MNTQRGLRGLVVVMSFVSAAMVAAMASAAPPSIGTQVSPTLGPTVQGTIAWASANGQYLRLKDGTQLIVPENVNVPRAMLTQSHHIKAFYTPTSRGNVVSVIEVLALHPGNGGGIEG
jgi:hypothetical protein